MKEEPVGEYVECCDCHKTVRKDEAEPAELLNGEPVWVCGDCHSDELWDHISDDLFDA